MNKENILMPIAVVFVAGVLGVTGMLTGGKEITNNTLDTSKIVENQATEQQVGGLVMPYQQIFPSGLVVGEKEKGNSEAFQIFTDSSGNLYIGSSTDATFKMSKTGRITLRDINFTTSTLNWGGSFSAGDGNDFYVDADNQKVGIGTSTPTNLLTLRGVSTGAGVAPNIMLSNNTTTDTNFGLYFDEASTQVFSIVFDDVNNKLLFTTSSDSSPAMTISYSGGTVAFLQNATVAGTLTTTGLVTASSDLEVATNFAVGTTTNTTAFTVQTATSTFYSVNNASTTVYVFSGTPGYGGRIILEDPDGAGCTAITGLNGAVSGENVTCPTY